MDSLDEFAAHALDWMSCTSKRGKVIARALLIERARTKRLRAELEEMTQWRDLYRIEATKRGCVGVGPVFEVKP